MKFTLLDTNHYSALTDSPILGANIRDQAVARDAELFTSIITVQEVSQGWFAWINSKPQGESQVHGYGEFQHNLEAFCKITVLPFDEGAAWHFTNLKKQRLRIGTMDLKIASICLAHDAMLLSRNRVDFERVPDLKLKTGSTDRPHS